MVAPHQHDCKRKAEQQQNPYDDPQYLMPVRFRAVSRELMVAIDDGMLACVNGQKESPFLGSKLLKIIFQFAIVTPFMLLLQRVSEVSNSAQNFEKE